MLGNTARYKAHVAVLLEMNIGGRLRTFGGRRFQLCAGCRLATTFVVAINSLGHYARTMDR